MSNQFADLWEDTLSVSSDNLNDIMFDSLETIPSDANIHVDDDGIGQPSPPSPSQRPSLISLDSQVQGTTKSASAPPTETPYDSLKSLIRFKQAEAAGLGVKRSHSEPPSAGAVPSSITTTFAVDHPPPAQSPLPVAAAPPLRVIPKDTAAHLELLPCLSSLAAAAPRQHQVPPPPKRRKTTNNIGAQLHRDCRDGADLKLETVNSALAEDPDCAGRSMTVYTIQNIYDIPTHTLKSKYVREPYTYPLNLALAHQAEAAVVERLLEADMSVLTKPDGPQRETSLHVLLQHCAGKDYAATVDAMLLTRPEIASTTDRRGNTPLHVACRSGVDLTVIKHLVLMFPRALRLRNFDGQTPLDLARRCHCLCGNPNVASFLSQKVEQAVASTR